MVDTVGFQLLLKLHDPLTARKSLQRQGISVGVSNGHITWVAASLPRILFGQNSTLIRNQAQLNDALAKLDSLLAQFGTIVYARQHFTRVDLVWQFKRRVARFALSMFRVNHPEIRAEVCLFRNRKGITGIWWKSGAKSGTGGKGGPLIIRAYDKSDKGIKSPQPVLRIEVQLRGKKLTQKLGNNAPVNRLDIRDCYQAYRNTLLGFTPNPLPAVSSKNKLLMLAADELGIPIDELIADFSCDETMRRYRISASAAIASAKFTNLAMLLPPNALPPVVQPGPMVKIGSKRKKTPKAKRKSASI